MPRSSEEPGADTGWRGPTGSRLMFWISVTVGVWHIIGARNLGLISAGVAFYALLSIFPAVAAIISLFGFFADPLVIEAQMELLREFVPEDAFELLSAQVDRLIAARDYALGWTSLVSVLIVFWTARLGVAAIIRGMTAIYGREPRGGLWHTITALALTAVLIGVAIVALALVVVLPVVLAFVPQTPLTGVILESLRWVLAVCVAVFGIALLYRYGPNRNGPRTRWFSPGLLMAVILWAATSISFSWFLGNFGNYNEVYGSIGAVVALLMWFYISAFVILLGAALNAEMERLSPFLRGKTRAVQGGADGSQ